jgi:outer membrane protein
MPARSLPLCFLTGVLALGFWTYPTGAADPPKPRGLITLEQAYDQTLATDQTIKIAYWEVRKANLLPWSALTRLGPQITADGGYTRGETFTKRAVDQTVIDSVGQPATLTTPAVPALTEIRTVDVTTRAHAGTSNLGLTYLQPLIDLTVFPAYRVGKISTVITRLQHQFTIRGTLYGVMGAYYEVLKQQRLVEVDRETLRLSGEQLDLAQKRADAGEVTRADVLRATVTVETARRVLVEDDNVLELDRNTLRNILNYAPNAEVDLVEPPDYPATLPAFEDLLKRAYSQREDLRAKDLAIDQDIARRNQVIGEYGPRVVAQFDTSRGHISGSANSSDYDWQAGVSVQVPIFTGGQREVDLLTADRQIEQTRLDRERTAKTVEADVKQAWLAVRTLKQTIKALHAQVVAAEQGYHDLQIQYAAGTATSVDVLSALNDLNTARKDLAVQTYDYQVALRNLEQTSGIFQEPRVRSSKIK